MRPEVSQKRETPGQMNQKIQENTPALTMPALLKRNADPLGIDAVVRKNDPGLDERRRRVDRNNVDTTVGHMDPMIDLGRLDDDPRGCDG